MTAKQAIHGFREPDLSAIAPRTGESTAMITEEIVAMLLHIACALTGSLVSRETKYTFKEWYNNYYRLEFLVFQN